MSYLLFSRALLFHLLTCLHFPCGVWSVPIANGTSLSSNGLLIQNPPTTNNSSQGVSPLLDGVRVVLVNAYPPSHSPYYYQQWQLLFDCIDMVWELAHMPFYAPLKEFATFSTSYYAPSLIAYNNAKTVDGIPVSTVGNAIRAFTDTAKIIAYQAEPLVPFFIRTYLDGSSDFIGQGCILRQTATNSTSSSDGAVSISSDQKNSSFTGKVASPGADFQLTYLRHGAMLIANHVLLMAACAMNLNAREPPSWYLAHGQEYRFPATVNDIQINLVKTWADSPLRNKDVLDALRSVAFRMWENRVFAEADLGIMNIVAGRLLHIATLQIRHSIAAEGLAID